MISKIKTAFLALISKEVAACRNRYNNKCAECRGLLEKIEGQEEDVSRLELKAEMAKERGDALESEVEALNLQVQEFENNEMLTAQVVKQQQYMIQRDIELRRLEFLDASIKVNMANSMTDKPGIKDDSNVTNESEVNYRAGR